VQRQFIDFGLELLRVEDRQHQELGLELLDIEGLHRVKHAFYRLET
jgi:hypothetical protein